jgi:hypothetical protein
MKKYSIFSIFAFIWISSLVTLIYNDQLKKDRESTNCIDLDAIEKTSLIIKNKMKKINPSW